MRRRLVMVLAWLAVVPLTAAPAVGRSVPERAGIAVTAARLDALHLRIHGDRAQRQASELLSYHQIEGGMKACMRAAGKPYRVPPRS